MTFGPFSAEEAPAALAGLLDRFGSDTAVTIGVVPSLLTIAQAADVLGCSRRHVARLVDTGALSADFHGLHRRVLRSHVLDLAKQQAEVVTTVLDGLADLTRREGLYDPF
ncbi:helix-turn-helix domain-containing protein [Rhodococcus pyridinivorans]|uniref:helix-turn-helix domain-containing protein n=1 Tax=Rhodococcus pyridinivorans TaxID=103816 RepID=UPI001E44242B|nr:helix-turn-helix domain-containing protein [Rhodococcus pyridinivorans]MCD5419185.1 helix-turn-helix domain-containing protein [Rhodococcus pyridinivorans]